MPFPASGAAIPNDVPISAIEAELRRLGLNSASGTVSVLPPPPMDPNAVEPQSAVASIIEARKAAAAKAAPSTAPPPAPTPLPTTTETPEVAPPPADDSGISPWWLLPMAIAGALAGRAGRKGVARVAKGAEKGAAEAPAPKAATVKHPSQRTKVQHPSGAGRASPKQPAYGPHQPYGPQRPPMQPGPAYGPQLPYGPQRPPMQGPPAPVAPVTDVAPPAGIVPNADGTLPPPTLTQTDATSAIPLALAERARGNIRVPGDASRLPPPVTPRPVLPPYTAPLDEAADIQGSELAKAIRIAGQVARERGKSAAKTEKINRKRPGPVDRPPQQFTPDRRVPREEGERKSWNEVTKAIREAKNPPKAAEKDLKPWLKEPKKDIGGPVLPKKKPGPAPKLKRKPVPETDTAKELAARKVTARKGKTTPQQLSETGRKRPEAPKPKKAAPKPKPRPVDKTPLKRNMGLSKIVEDADTGKITLHTRNGWYLADGKTAGVFNSKAEANKAIAGMNMRTTPVKPKTKGSGTLSLRDELAKRKRAKGK